MLQVRMWIVANHAAHALPRMLCRCGNQVMLIEQFERDGLVDVLGAVCQLRQDRGFTVQTADQYVFIHKVGFSPAI